jgi:hypothetical protein
MKQSQRIWVLLLLVSVATMSAMLGGISTRIFNPSVVLVFLAGAVAGLLISLFLTRPLRGNQPGS